eukprot:gene5025-biopygen6628
MEKRGCLEAADHTPPPRRRAARSAPSAGVPPERAPGTAPERAPDALLPSTLRGRRAGRMRTRSDAPASNAEAASVTTPPAASSASAPSPPGCGGGRQPPPGCGGGRQPPPGCGGGRQPPPWLWWRKTAAPLAVVAEDSRPLAVVAEDSRPLAVVAEDSRPLAVAAEDSRPLAVVAEDSRPLAVVAEDSRPLAVAAEDSRPLAVVAEDSRTRETDEASRVQPRSASTAPASSAPAEQAGEKYPKARAAAAAHSSMCPAATTGPLNGRAYGPRAASQHKGGRPSASADGRGARWPWEERRVLASTAPMPSKDERRARTHQRANVLRKMHPVPDSRTSHRARRLHATSWGLTARGADEQASACPTDRARDDGKDASVMR